MINNAVNVPKLPIIVPLGGTGLVNPNLIFLKISIEIR